jgi:hypothetical protein
MPTPEPLPTPPATGKASLWIAVLGTPALFALHLTLYYVLVPVLCRQQRVWVFHVITGVLLLLTTVALGLAARDWSRLASRKPSPDDDVEALGRAQFLAVLGTIVATLFFSVILASGIPPFFVDPCQD